MPEQEETKPDTAPKPLRTFQGDVEAILKGGAGSLAKIAIAENEKKVRSGFLEEDTEKPQHTKLIIWVSVSLIALGLGIFGVLYFLRTPADAVPKTPDVPPIIAADVEKKIDVTSLNRNQIVDALTAERDGSIAQLSSVVSIRLTKKSAEGTVPISAEDFFSKLGARVPNALLRSLDSNFMFGIHVLARNQPFLILKAGYYQNAFTGMLAWETNLRDDLGPIFIPPEPVVTASTTEEILKKSRSFQDIVIKNRDARALRGEDEKVIFLYSFPDKNTIVITTNPDTLEQVTARLLAGKLVQ